jgi:hypothetical protein
MYNNLLPRYTVQGTALQPLFQAQLQQPPPQQQQQQGVPPQALLHPQLLLLLLLALELLVAAAMLCTCRRFALLTAMRAQRASRELK